MNATEARQLTNQSNDVVSGPYKQIEFKRILEQIKQAAAEGQDYLYIGQLAPINFARLKSLGYKVSYGGQREEGASIKW